jgi:predicted phosphodiesterase
MVKIRIMSDLHLEFYKHVSKLERHIQWTEDDKYSHLILAGDIGNPLTARKKKGPYNYKPNGHFVDLLKMFKSRFLSVTMISGNHEYYACQSHKRTMEEMDQILKTMADSVGVTFLQCNTVTILPDKHNELTKPIVIYGATLFTPVTEAHSREMNDIVYIGNRDSIVAKHEEHLAWLTSQTFSENCYNIVVTHHVPLCGNHSGYYAGIIGPVRSAGGATDVFEPLVVRFCGPIKYWVCGHTHTNIDQMVTLDSANDLVGPTQVMSCCLGYPNERQIQSPVYLMF